MIQRTQSSPPVSIDGLSSNQWMQLKGPIHKSSPPIVRLQYDCTSQVGFGSQFHPLMIKNTEDVIEIQLIELVLGTGIEATTTNPTTSKEKRKRSPPKDNIPFISKVNGFDSPSKMKVIKLKDSGLESQKQHEQITATIVPRTRNSCK